MGSLRWALSWLVVVAVGLSPLLVYWVAGLISRAFRHKSGRPPKGSAPVQPLDGECCASSKAAPPT
jgi:hypothetical protein